MRKIKDFEIVDKISGMVVRKIPAASGKSALGKFKRSLLAPEIYEIHHDLFTGEWNMRSIYGSYFVAREVV